MSFRNVLCVCVVAGLLCASGGCVMEADYNDVKTKLASVGADLQKTRDELGQTKVALENAQGDCEKARSDLANERENLSGQIRLAKDESAKLTTERDGLKTQLQAAQGKVQSLEEAAKTDQQTQARTATELAEAKAEVEKLNGQILTLQAEIKAQAGVIQELQAMLKAAQAKTTGVAPKN